MKLSYLVDTDWIIHYLNGHEIIIDKISLFKNEGLAVSIISLAELYEGVYYSTNPRENEQVLQDFLTGFTVLDINEETCQIFGKTRGRLRQEKKLISEFDLMIAATCLYHKLILLSNNQKHFKMVEGLQIISVT